MIKPLLSKLLIFSLMFVSLHAADFPSSGLYIGARGSRMDWKSSSDGTYTGYLIGPDGGIDYRRPYNIYVGYRFYYVFGHLSSGGQGRSFSDLNMQTRVGYSVGKQLMFTPYVGLGFNSAEHKIDGASSPGNKFAYTDVYVPIGALLTYHFSKLYSIGIDYQYMPQVDSFGRVAGYKAIRFELNEQSQHSVELPIQFVFGKSRWEHAQYRFIPFFRTYRYGGTKVVSFTNSSISLNSQRAYEWGLKYEIAIY